MQRYFKIPFWFLVLAASIGLLLRVHLVSPIDYLVYGNWLHAHSHLMFLGWLFNFFNLAFIYRFIPAAWDRRYKGIFIVNQILTLGMLVFFPLQGYGPVTISLSAAHTIVSAIFCFRFFTDTKDQKHSLSRWLAVWALIFFLVSAAGPFTLGPLMANGLGQSKWYFFAIYFYLHFQYNGFFFFAILALFFRDTEERGLQIRNESARRGSLLLVLAVFGTFVLSVLWARPGIVFNIAGFISAAIQIIALVLILKGVLPARRELVSLYPGINAFLLKVVLVSVVMKLILQLVSAHPEVARLAYENRYFVIAYLHLVLIGIISLFVFVWYMTHGFLKNIPVIFVILILTGFAGSELLLISLTAFDFLVSKGSLLIMCFSLIMFAGITGLLIKLTSGR